VIRTATADAVRLDEATEQIFQGLITGADDVYLLEDRGERAGLRVVWSHASQREVEMEPNLLRQLASGSDVERFAFRQLTSLLLFPYTRDNGQMRLVDSTELERLGRTKAYFDEHEVRLRGREGARMDHPGWYAFVRTQNLSLHDRPKLGVAATVRRLEIAADLEGAVYFHNVRVNGILERAGVVGLPILPSAAELSAPGLDLQASRGDPRERLLRCQQAVHRRPPDRGPDGREAHPFEELGRRLHARASEISHERGGFLAWLTTTLDARRGALPGLRALARYDELAAEGVIGQFVRSRSRLGVDPRERSIRELIEREHRRSVDRLVPLKEELGRLEIEADGLVYELYRLPSRMRELVDSEYAA
jgi:hypothetical protein